ncbi:MAG: hypothetical protein IJK99_10675 [Bacteroidales bacterium]|nr:hypothetical protein [Bacteroidales bacterium]
MQSDMEYAAAIERPNAVRAAHSARGRKPIDTTQAIERTPESELMEVDEYFDILHKMVDEYYDSIQS